MDKREWQKIEQIIDGALKRSGEERTNYIDKQCKGNRELKNKVTNYLKAIKKSKGFLEDEIQKNLLINDYLDDLKTVAPNLLGEVIGNYKVTQLLRYGGLRYVFLAVRTDEKSDDKVVLRIIRQGIDTTKSIARFERKREILSGLSHPNIAELYDHGVTENGLPYLVMKYIDGTTIGTYCDKKSLSISERLSLFKDICQGIQYAHDNQIIHRNLKPGNILVTDNAEVKILGFGASKLISDEEPETVTQQSPQILAPAYAAPEQFKYNSITTAIDNYALGALLYKLVSGVSIFDLNNKSRTEIKSIITDETPIAPSKRLKELENGTQKTIAEHRNSSISKIISSIQGDLDAVVLKAVHKEPSARYPSPDQLADDISRYQNGQPISAR